MYRLNPYWPKIEERVVFKATPKTIIFPTRTGPLGKPYHPREKRHDGEWFDTWEAAKQAAVERAYERLVAAQSEVDQAMRDIEQAEGLSDDD